MRISFSVLVVTLTCVALAKGEKHSHREHEAHVHGGGTLSIAFDQSNGKIDFKSAAEAILGFEHKAKSAKDQTKLQSETQFFEANIAQMIQFEPTLKCQFVKEQVGQVVESGQGSGEHSDWAAQYQVTCAQSPKGSRLVIDFGRYAHLNDVDLTLLLDELQKSAKYKGNVLKIDLK